MTNKMCEMTWQEFAARKEDYIVLPVGSTEQHGPHLPLSVDRILAEGFADAIAEGIGGVVAPTLNYGYKSQPFSGGGPLFPGTIDLNGATLRQLVEDICEEFIRDGFRKILVFSAHFENEAFINEALDLVSRRHGEVRLLLMNWWDVIPDSFIPTLFGEVPFPGWALEHAAFTETSLMLYLAPELVRVDKIRPMENIHPDPAKRYPVEPGFISPDGVLASAVGSSAEKGKLLFDYSTARIVDYILHLEGE